MGHAIGIDLGTTYSAAAILQADGKPAILPNSEGQNITPSVVLFPDVANGYDEPLVGDMAKHSVATSPLDVVQFVKRQMAVRTGDLSRQTEVLLLQKKYLQLF